MQNAALLRAAFFYAYRSGLYKNRSLASTIIHMQKFLLPRLVPALLLAALVALLSSCHFSEPIKDAEAMRFAKEVEQSFRIHDASVINNMIDKDELARRVASHAAVGLDFSMKKGIRDGLSKLRLGDQIMAGGACYELVKHYVKKGHQHLIFRLYSSSNGINYHDYELVKHKGKIYVADIYLYLMGQDLSEVMGRTINIFKEKDMSSDTYVRGAELIKKMEQQIQNADFEAAQETYRLVPREFKQNKICRLSQIQISLGLDDTAAYNKQVQAYLADFPQNPDIYMIRLDAGFVRKDYNMLLNAVDSLDHFINKDPFLDYYRGLTYRLMGKQDSAVVYFKQLHQSFPEMQEALIELIASDIDAGKAEEARAMISRYRQNTAYDQEMLRMLPVNRPEYEAYFE